MSDRGAIGTTPELDTPKPRVFASLLVAGTAVAGSGVVAPGRGGRAVHDQQSGAAERASPLPRDNKHHQQRALGGSGPYLSGKELAERFDGEDGRPQRSRRRRRGSAGSWGTSISGCSKRLWRSWRRIGPLSSRQPPVSLQAQAWAPTSFHWLWDMIVWPGVYAVVEKDDQGAAPVPPDGERAVPAPRSPHPVGGVIEGVDLGLGQVLAGCDVALLHGIRETRPRADSHG
jgi:hypothetical protein